MIAYFSNSIKTNLTWITLGVPFLMVWLLNTTPLLAQHPPNVYTVEKIEVTDHIFTMVRPDWLRRFVVGNISVVQTDEGLIVFDSGNSPYVAQQAIDEIKKKTTLPVKYLIVSHGHIDHTGGIATFKSEWPQMEIIGHATVYKYMKRDQGRLLGFAAGHEKNHRKRDSLMKAFKKEGHDPKVVQYHQRYLDQDAPFIAEQYRQTQVELPTITIRDSLNIYLGGQEFRVFHSGKAHTPSDIMLYSPKEKILFTGDVLTRPVPYGFTKHGKDWTNVLRQLLKLEIEQIVPGHGAPLKGAAYLAKQKRLFETIVGHIEKGVNEDLPLDDVKESLDLTEKRTLFTANDPMANYRFNTWFLDPFVERNYKFIKAKVRDLKTVRVPAPRSGFCIAYDPIKKAVLLFGGQDSLDNKLNDSWTWKVAEGWKKLSSTGPTPRINAAMTFNKELNGMVLYGGLTDQGCSNELWLFKENQWKPILSKNAPPARQLGTMAYNTTESRMVLFGGKDDDNARLGDTWSFTNGEWKQLDGSGPSARSSHCITDYPPGKSILIYGGYDGNVLGDMWELKNDTWRKLGQMHGPGRLHSSISYDADREQLILFGGFGDQGRTNDTWLFSDEQKNWKLMEINMSPPPRAEHEIIHVPGEGVFAFGGVIGEDPRKRIRSNDMWMLKKDWIQVD